MTSQMLEHDAVTANLLTLGARVTAVVLQTELQELQIHRLLSQRIQVVVASCQAAGSKADVARLLLSRAHSEMVTVVGIGTASTAAVHLATDGPIGQIHRLVLVSPDLAADDLARLRTFTGEALVVFGTESDAVREARHHEYVDVDGCNLALVYAADHQAHLQRPEAVADLVADFAERGAAFALTMERSLINP